MTSLFVRQKLAIALCALVSLQSLTLGSSYAGDDFILFAPLTATSTYLVDKDNNVVKEWLSDYRAGQSAYLLEDGSILRAGKTQDPDNFFVRTIAALPGTSRRFSVGGIIERISVDNEIVWQFSMYDDTVMPHHDAEMLPNGNVLLIAWEYKSKQEAIDAGRDPSTIDDSGLWVDAVFEIEPVGDTGGRVVWEWHAWDHMVQDFDPAKTNYGKLSENPGKLNINNDDNGQWPADLMHTNSVSYIAQWDQIIFSSNTYSELYIIDHSTTSSEAAGKTGGKYGRGGEFLYRWGNPAMYGADNTGAFTLSGVHDPNWIEGTDHIIMFDNNAGQGNAKVVEILLPQLSDGSYDIGSDGFYGPLFPVYIAELDFQELSLGAAQRLSSGDTFTCECTKGRAIFLAPDGTVLETRDVAENIDLRSPPAFRLIAYPEDFEGVERALR